MTLPLFNVGGLATGLDTNSIIKQLMDVERVPLTQLQRRRTAYQDKDSAWQKILTRIQALHEKVNAVAERSGWDTLLTGTSSDPAAVAVSVSGADNPTSLSFTVDRLASTHQVSAATVFSAGTDPVGAGTLTLTVGATNYTVDTDASTTLAGLVTEINALEAGVNARLVTVDANQLRLVIRADQSGDDGQFTASGTQATLQGFSTVETGLDARLTLGSGAGAITVERSSNTITDLVAGLTLNLKAVTTSAVTVISERDIEGAVTMVKDMVDELNSALSTISGLTTYHAETGAASALAGDSSVRNVVLRLRSALSSAVGLTGDYRHAGSVGISLSRDGSIIFDETKLRDALEDDFEGVMDLFTRAGSTTDPRATFAAATLNTVDGSYLINITTAAGRASVQGIVYIPPAAPETFTVTSDGVSVSVTLAAGDDLATAISKINAAMASAQVQTISASEVGGAIQLEETRYGTAAAFSVSPNSFGLEGTFAGVDVAGTIGGDPSTGSGQLLTSTSGSSNGVTVGITASASEVSAAGGSLDLGSVSVTTGFAKRLEELLDTFEGTNGAIDRARDRWQSQIDLLDDRIEVFQDRLERREAALLRQFTALETAMSRLIALSNSLTAQLNSLQGGSQT
jgi:flagellar hook-associated protein 2